MSDSSSTVARRPSAVPAYLLGFVMMGITVSIAGPALSHLRDRMHTNDGGIAWVFAGTSIGYILGSAFSGPRYDRGQGHRWWVGAMVVATGSILLVAVAPNLPLLVLSFAILGASCALCDVGGNSLVMWSRPEGPGSLLNALHLCFAIGALSAPVLVNRSLHYTHSVWGVAVPVAIIAVVCSALMLPHEPPRQTRTETRELSDATGGRTLHVAVVCAFFFAYVALETGFAGWIHTYTEQIHYGGSGTATGMLTTFWGGFALGRMASIWLAARVSPGWMVACSTSVCVIAAGLFLAFDGGGPMLWVVTFLFAVSVAPQYASMMAFAESHLALSGRNTSAILASSGLGGLVLPWSIGQLFDAVGPKAMAPTVFVAACVTALIGLGAGRLLLAAHRPPVTSMNAPVT